MMGCARRTGCWAGLLALLVCAGVRPPRLHAQGEAGGTVHYTRKSVFLIPFEPDPGRRLTQVRLYVSRDEGRTYDPVATALPDARQFRYEAKEDGWYWFSVQTTDDRGQTNPPDVQRYPPGLKIYVDTRPPRATLASAVPTSHSAAIKWDILDDYPQLYSLRIEYRVPGARNWVDLNVPKIARGVHEWDPVRPGEMEVRLLVADRAGNTSEATAKVNADPAAARKPATHRPAGKVLHVKNRTFRLNYTIKNVGPSEVKYVKVWYTRDGNKYELYPGEAPPVGPHTVEVEREGRYGFTLVPYSGVGLAPPPPRAGDEPQLWVEVDETPPKVTIRQVIVGRGPERGKMTIAWEAKDLFLTAQPITVTYAPTPEGPWKDLLTSIANTGMTTCACDRLPYQFYLRVEAVDEAGNKGGATTPDLVKVDLQIPQIDSVGVTAGGM